jgi:hypothetical protein
MTSVKDRAFYGWPYSYYGQHVDERVKPQKPDLVAKALQPDYALGPHTASLGLAAARGNNLGPQFANGMFVGQHGSWNRKPRSGYKVIFVPFNNGKPSAQPIDVLTGFVSDDGKAWGRPVGVAIDKKGALLVADDVGNAIWRVATNAPAVAAVPPVPPAATDSSTTPAATGANSPVAGANPPTAPAAGADSSAPLVAAGSPAAPAADANSPTAPGPTSPNANTTNTTR